MGKKYIFVTLLSLMTLSFACFENNNPFDEKGTNYTPPKITIDEEASSFKQHDTVHYDSVSIVIDGNRDQSIFNLKIDNSDWTEKWEPAGTFGFGGLSDGKHTLYIKSKYEGGERVVSDSVIFYILTKGYKPEFTKETDTTITSFEGKSIILSVKADGYVPLEYSWVKGTTVIEGMNTDSLKIASFLQGDAASYKCIVSNAYGSDTSRTFTLKYRPFSGGIKGVVTDTSGSKLKGAVVTLLPVNKKDTTDTSGSFAFSSLSGMVYSLHVSLAEYHDTTHLDVMVNDTETVIFPAVKLKFIDTTTYKLAYSGNGNDSGTVPVDSNKYYKGREVTVAGNPGNLYRNGFYFSGWNTEADGKGDGYNAGSKFVMPDSAVTLYVKWSINPTYSINYHSISSTGGNVPATVNADSGVSITVADSGSLYKTGYTFAGWNTKEDLSGKVYKTGDVMVMDTVDVDLYVQWTKAQFTITYHGNGSTGGIVPPKTTHLFQTEITIAGLVDLVKTGHSFVGWNLDSAGNGLDYQPGDKITVDKNINLYARWIKKKFMVSYSGNGNDVGSAPAEAEYEYGTTVIVASKGNLVRTGYTFVNWTTNNDGTGTEYAPNSKFTLGAENIILIAKWKNPDGMVQILTKGNSFMMGRTSEQVGHKVEFSADLWMDTTEVTQFQYDSLMRMAYADYPETSPRGTDRNYPVNQINWFDAVLFCNARTKGTGSNDTVYRFSSISGEPGNGCRLIGLSINMSGRGFRLPTEAEWEYACRGGSTTDYYWGNDSSLAGNYEWYVDNSGAKLHPVAQKFKNAYNLFDMSGNLIEWCNDWYGEYASQAQIDPIGPSTGERRVVRGGYWSSGSMDLRSASRYYGDPCCGVMGIGTTIYGFRTCIPIR